MQLVPTRVDDEVAQTLLDDYFTSRELGFVTHAEGYRRTNPDPAAFTPPKGLFVVVRNDRDEPVGCGGVRRVEDYLGEPTFEVKHLWVAPSQRGRGISRTLMAGLEEAAIEYGAHWLVLDTNETLTAAQQLYRSSGFVEIDAYNDNPNATHWFAKRVHH